MSRKLLMLVWLPKSKQQGDAGFIQPNYRSHRLRFEIVSTEGGRIQHGQERLSDLPRNIPCTLLVHPDDVSVFKPNLPKLSDKQLDNSLPFLIEPELIDAPEDNYVGLLNKPLGWVGAINRRVLTQLLEPFKHIGMQVQGLSVEPAILHSPNSGAWMIADADHFWICVAGQAPWALDSQHIDQNKQRFAWWVSRLATPPEQWTVIGASADQKAWLSDLLGPNTQWPSRSQLTPVDAVAAGLMPTFLLKKMLGKSTHVNQIQRRHNQLFRWVAVLLLGWLVGLNAYAFVQKSRFDSVLAVAEKSFEQTLPNTPMVADPVLLLERAKNDLLKHSSGKTSDGFTGLMHQAGLAMASLPINVVESANWKDKRLVLSLNTDPGQQGRSAVESVLKSQRIIAQWGQDDKKRVTLTLSSGVQP